MLVQMFWNIGTLSIKTERTNPLKNLNHQHFIHLFTTIPLAQEGFPSPNPSSEATAAVGLRIHGCLGLQKQLHNPLCAFLGCEVQRCWASGAAAPYPNPAGRTQRNQGEKNSEKILAPQKSVLWKVWPLKLLPGLKEHCGFEMSWGHRIGWNAFWFCSLLKPCRPCWQSRWLGWTQTYST